MRQDQFAARYRREWEAFAETLDLLEKSPRQVTDIAEFPHRYRRLCQHYSLARSRAYSATLTDRLHALVLRAHQRFYGSRRPWLEQLLGFVLQDYPRLIRREWRFVAVSAAVFFGGIVALMWGVHVFPDLVYTLLDADDVRTYESMYDPQLRSRFGREDESASDFLMFGYYIRNNTSIGFQTFAGGVLFGLGTLFYIAFNGVLIGAIAGHLTAIGYGETFWSFVAGHSAFELTAIALSGAAGLRVGWALLSPGRKTRPRALRDAAAVGVRIVYGAAVLFLMAAFIEGFWSSKAALPPLIKYTTGVLLWILLLAYFLVSGRQGARRGP